MERFGFNGSFSVGSGGFPRSSESHRTLLSQRPLCSYLRDSRNETRDNATGISGRRFILELDGSLPEKKGGVLLEDGIPGNGTKLQV